MDYGRTPAPSAENHEYCCCSIPGVKLIGKTSTTRAFRKENALSQSRLEALQPSRWRYWHHRTWFPRFARRITLLSVRVIRQGGASNNQFGPQLDNIRLNEVFVSIRLRPARPHPACNECRGRFFLLLDACYSSRGVPFCVPGLVTYCGVLYFNQVKSMA